jgi:protein-S-isoprenylcysteine O-methyltransferase Ste14
LFVPIILGRIRSEERLLASHFGAEYEAYRARTWHLVPGVY